MFYSEVEAVSSYSTGINSAVEKPIFISFLHWHCYNSPHLQCWSFVSCVWRSDCKSLDQNEPRSYKDNVCGRRSCWIFLRRRSSQLGELISRRYLAKWDAFRSPLFLSKVKAAPTRCLAARSTPQLPWTVLYTPWGWLSKNLAWWQPDNSIHLIYPLDSADLLWQSIMLTISFPPGAGGRGRYTSGGGRLGRCSLTKLDSWSLRVARVHSSHVAWH